MQECSHNMIILASGFFKNETTTSFNAMYQILKIFKEVNGYQFCKFHSVIENADPWFSFVLAVLNKQSPSFSQEEL